LQPTTQPVFPQQRTRPQQIGQQSGVAEIGLVGILFHPCDESGMRQAHRPFGTLMQIVGQIRRPTAGLDGHRRRPTKSLDHPGDHPYAVSHPPIQQHVALGVENTPVLASGGSPSRQKVLHYERSLLFVQTGFRKDP